MKEVLAYREIKKENNIKKSAIILEVLLVVLLICAIICLINPTGEEGINILGYILMGMAVLYVFGIITSPYIMVISEVFTALIFIGTMIIGDRRARVELYRRFHIN